MKALSLLVKKTPAFRQGFCSLISAERIFVPAILTFPRRALARLAQDRLGKGLAVVLHPREPLGDLDLPVLAPLALDSHDLPSSVISSTSQIVYHEKGMLSNKKEPSRQVDGRGTREIC
jgi:hypothetical protein